VRTIILGGPSRGKSTLAETYKARGIPVFCGDPASTVLYQKAGTTYLPEGLPFAGDGGGGDWVARNWFLMPGPWVCEGHVMARALRRWLDHYDRSRGDPRTDPDRMPADRIIVLDCHAHRYTGEGRERMHRSVIKVWREVEHRFPRSMVETRTEVQPLLGDVDPLR
jgi:hypothetical protein